MSIFSAVSVSEADIPYTVQPYGYRGRKYQVEVTDQVIVPVDAGLWSGGSRELYEFLHIATGQNRMSPGQRHAPWDCLRQERCYQIEPGFIGRRQSTFCGKDAGYTYYVHPDDKAKFNLP